jgi:hypothetical protein
VSEQWRGIPEVAVLTDGHQSRQFRQLEHFGNSFHPEISLKGITRSVLFFLKKYLSFIHAKLDTQSAHSLCKESHALTGDGTIGWTAKQDW